VMKRRVERIRPRNVEELKAVVQRTWDSLHVKTINRMIEEILRSLIQVIVNEGRRVQHLEFIHNWAKMDISEHRIDEKVLNIWSNSGKEKSKMSQFAHVLNRFALSLLDPAPLPG
jgi:hypothetical protein